jgi:hypothetical protein
VVVPAKDHVKASTTKTDTETPPGASHKSVAMIGSTCMPPGAEEIGVSTEQGTLSHGLHPEPFPRIC